MNPSETFIRRPVATTLLTAGIAMLGLFAFCFLPVSAMPHVNQPSISVSANMPGASPETMANSVATPLERHLGQIAGVTAMSSSCGLGNCGISLNFDMDRDIDGAARDVQAAINAARADLPAGLQGMPSYHKDNSADFPIMILSLSSKVLTPGEIYDAASTILSQKFSQVPGVGSVGVTGSSLPAVRVELNPNSLFKYGIGPESVRAAIAAANANAPKGAIEAYGRRSQIYTNDQTTKAAAYASLVVGYRNSNPIRLDHIAAVSDSVEDVRNMAWANGGPAVLVFVNREPGANIIATVDRIREVLPSIQAALPPSIDLRIDVDRTGTIRASVSEVERTLIISVGLVVLVVFLFLRDPRAALIPCIAVPVALIGSCTVMWLLHYSIDNLSLMALIIVTGFVVDDAIVVLENSYRHVEAGMAPLEAARLSAKEVGFTVISMNCALVVVFLPILALGGVEGRMFREFCITLSSAIVISVLMSLSTTPMLCAYLLKRPQSGPRGGWGLDDASRHLIDGGRALYGWTLTVALRHPVIVLGILITTMFLNVTLLSSLPKSYFPQQDTGMMLAGTIGDQTISFRLMQEKMRRLVQLVTDDPAIDSVAGFTGGRSTNGGFMFVQLKPLRERDGVEKVMDRLRQKSRSIIGTNCWFASAQEVQTGSRQGNANYQYTLQADDLASLRTWAPRLKAALVDDKHLVDVSSDQNDGGLETELTVDRDLARRFNLEQNQIDSTLYDCFGQRQVSTIYLPMNQYHVVMEVDPRYWDSPAALKDIYVSQAGAAVSGTQATNIQLGSGAGASSQKNLSQNALANSGGGAASTGTAISTTAESMIPLAAFSSFAPGVAPLAVNHQGNFVSSTLSFNVPLGGSLAEAMAAIEHAMSVIGMPASIHRGFQGAAQADRGSFGENAMVLLSALVAVYIVLGILYESFIHPLTVLSTLPSAGLGAFIALKIVHLDFSNIAMLGVILLIGIVSKNAIMMIDVAIDFGRHQGMSARDAIFAASLLRFRPIMMTTCVALISALPLAIGFGEGSEMRKPLGIAIVGGLIVSQMLTLYTTPVVYLVLDHLRVALRRLVVRPALSSAQAPA